MVENFLYNTLPSFIIILCVVLHCKGFYSNTYSNKKQKQRINDFLIYDKEQCNFIAA